MTLYELKASIDRAISNGDGDATAVSDCAGESLADLLLREVNAIHVGQQTYFDNQENPKSGKVAIIAPLSMAPAASRIIAQVETPDKVNA